MKEIITDITPDMSANSPISQNIVAAPSNGPNKKRKLDEEPSCSKRTKHDDDTEKPESPFAMLSDDILLIILSKLPTCSLLRLSKTCQLFSRLCEDYTLWRQIKCLDIVPTPRDLTMIKNLAHSETTDLEILSPCAADEQATAELRLEWLRDVATKCHNLQRLTLQKFAINACAVTMYDFPRTITHLDLSYSDLRNGPTDRSYFKDISEVMPGLKSLILSHCRWFEPHSLMALSKCRKLEDLILNDCVRIKDCLAYCGLSTRSGFISLKTLDLRRCFVTSSEVLCFSTVTTLKNLYLENPSLPTTSGNGIHSSIITLCTEEEVVAFAGRLVVKGPLLKLERLIVRNYGHLGDPELQKLCVHARWLEYLDVTGTGVTEDAVNNFTSMRQSVEVVWKDKIIRSAVLS